MEQKLKTSTSPKKKNKSKKKPSHTHKKNIFSQVLCLVIFSGLRCSPAFFYCVNFLVSFRHHQSPTEIPSFALLFVVRTLHRKSRFIGNFGFQVKPLTPRLWSRSSKVENYFKQNIEHNIPCKLHVFNIYQRLPYPKHDQHVSLSVFLLPILPKPIFPGQVFFGKCFESSPGKRKPPWQARQTEGLTVRKEKVSLVLMNWRTSKSCQRIHPDFGDLVGFSWGKKNPQMHGIYSSYEIYLYVNCKLMYI